jgi:hypothetical protein
MKEFKTPEYVTYYQGGKWHRVKQADFKPAVEIKTINDKILLDYLFKKGVTHASNT